MEKRYDPSVILLDRVMIVIGVFHFRTHGTCGNLFKCILGRWRAVDGSLKGRFGVVLKNELFLVGSLVGPRLLGKKGIGSWYTGRVGWSG